MKLWGKRRAQNNSKHALHLNQCRSAIKLGDYEKKIKLTDNSNQTATAKKTSTAKKNIDIENEIELTKWKCE